MSDQLTVPAADKSDKWDSTTRFKAAATIFLAASVFALAIIGKISVEEYIALIVTPGLAALGLHHSK